LLYRNFLLPLFYFLSEKIKKNQIFLSISLWTFDFFQNIKPSTEYIPNYYSKVYQRLKTLSD
jgi:hypothetical protein